MRCPQCKTENRENNETCYHCGQDMAVLRQLVMRARNHFNNALEHAERDRNDEAIAELNHALELDANFVQAWVVLGTLLAKQEKLDQANEAWARALAIEPTLEKAHAYLMKSRVVAGTLPAMNRVRKLAAGLAFALAALLVGLGALAFAYRSARAPEEASLLISEALNAREDDRWDEAVDLLGQAQHGAAGSELTRRVAGHVKEQIEADLARLLAEARKASEADDYAVALAAIAEVEAISPPEYVAEELADVNRRIHNRALGDARAAVDAFRTGEADFGELELSLMTLIALKGAGDQFNAQVTQLLDDARNKKEADERERIIKEVAQLDDVNEISRMIEQTRPLFGPGQSAELESTLSQRLSKLYEDAKLMFDAAIKGGEIERAREVAEGVRSLYAGVGRSMPAKYDEYFKSQIANRERRDQLAAAEAAYERDDWERFIKLAQKMDSSADEDPGLDGLETKLAIARAELATDIFQFCNKNGRDSHMRMLNFSLEEAAWIWDFRELSIDHKKNAFFRWEMMKYAAAAGIKLGKTDEADALLDQILEEVGSSANKKYFTDEIEALRGK